MKKKIAALSLALALLAGLFVPSAGAAGFRDITDPQVAQAAEILRELGVVNGMPGGTFQPDGTFTRAQFCKMALTILGRQGEASLQGSRVIFNDVTASHWALGYVNAAAQSSENSPALVQGRGNGCFQPDAAITFGEAVTVLMRSLGYSDQDVAQAGGKWYAGHLAQADQIGLTNGLTLSGDSPITRGQAAILFENMLYTSPKGSQEMFLVSQLGGSVVDNAIILSVRATAEDGTANSVEAVQGDATAVYKTTHSPFDTALEGTRASLVLDRNGRLLALRPSTIGTRRVVTLAEHEINYITTASGERLSVPSTTTTYLGSVSKPYADAYLSLKPGSRVTLSYSAAGRLEYLFLPQEDTTVNDPALRLSGIYEAAAPSLKTPLRLTMLGAEFEVLPEAMDAVAAHKLGDSLTLLLTADGKVAGVADGSAGHPEVVGIVTKADGSTATVEPLTQLYDANGNAIQFQGKAASSAKNLVGALVTVSSSQSGALTLARVKSSAVSGALDVARRTLGGVSLADQVSVYEQIAGNTPVLISWSQLTRDSVPAEKVVYAGVDAAGRVNTLVLDDVTGDSYHYGIAKVEQVTTGSIGGQEVTNTGVSVLNGKDAAGPYIGSVTAKNGDPIGIAPSVETINESFPRLGNWVALKGIESISRSAFAVTGEDGSAPIGTVTANGLTLPIAADVLCYNASAKTWFGTGAAGLLAARAYSAQLTIYYDRAPNEGGKVRMVVAE